MPVEAPRCQGEVPLWKYETFEADNNYNVSNVSVNDKSWLNTNIQLTLSDMFEAHSSFFNRQYTQLEMSVILFYFELFRA